MNFSKLCVVLIAFSIGCAYGPPSLLEGQGVDWKERESPLKINKNVALGPPADPETSQSQGKTARIPAVALVLGPGLKAAAHISLLKSLEKNDIPIHLITGHGLSAIFAALYASGSTPQSLEWYYYKFSQKTKNSRPFSQSWVNAVEETLLLPLKEKTIQGHRIKLIVPVYNTDQQKVEYFSRGKLLPKIRESLKTPAFENQIFNRKEQIRQGADVIIGSDVLPEQKAGQLSETRNEVDWLFELPTSSGNMQLILKKSFLHTQKECKKLKDFLLQWSEKNQ